MVRDPLYQLWRARGGPGGTEDPVSGGAPYCSQWAGVGFSGEGGRRGRRTGWTMWRTFLGEAFGWW